MEPVDIEPARMTNRTSASGDALERAGEAATSDTVAVPSGAPPAAAEELFGTRLDQTIAYAGLLATEGVSHGLLGPREVPRLWDRHLLNCAVVAALVPANAHLCDVGSGAGLPGIVIALARPDVQVVLLEPLLRRATFLDAAREQLALDNVEVVRGRAEEQWGRLTVDTVTARAVAPLDRLARWTMPLLRTGGELLALKGAGAPAELDAAIPTLRKQGATAWHVEQLGVAVLETPTSVVRVRKGVATASAPGRRRKGRR